MADLMSQKKHLLIFETEQGTLMVGTDDMYDLSEQRWFQAFLNIAPRRQLPSAPREEVRQLPPQQAAPVPRPLPVQRPPVQQAPPPMPSFMNMKPNEITDDVWSQLTPEEQDAYIKHYGLNS